MALPLADGDVTIRPPRPGDAALLIAGRDDEFHRWLGPGADDPRPTACIVVDDAVVGWVDFDADRDWLEPGEVNIGYNLFALHRGRGVATRAVLLLMQHLASCADVHTGTLLIDPGNTRSLRLAERAGFADHGMLGPGRYFKKAVR